MLHCARLYFNAVFQHKTTERSQKIKPLCQQKSRDPHRASLHAYNKAETAHEKCGFMLYFGTVFQHKTTERSQQIKPLCQQRSRDPHQRCL
jgi:hypothetical protein